MEDRKNRQGTGASGGKGEEMIGRLMDIFTSESIRYFTDIMDVDIFPKLFQEIAILMLREKQGVYIGNPGADPQRVPLKLYEDL